MQTQHNEKHHSQNTTTSNRAAVRTHSLPLHVQIAAHMSTTHDDIHMPAQAAACVCRNDVGNSRYSFRESGRVRRVCAIKLL